MRNGGIPVLCVVAILAACGGATRSPVEHATDRDAAPSGQTATSGASGKGAGGDYGGRAASGGVGTGGSFVPTHVGGFTAIGGSGVVSGGTNGSGGMIGSGGTIGLTCAPHF